MVSRHQYEQYSTNNIQAIYYQHQCAEKEGLAMPTVPSLSRISFNIVSCIQSQDSKMRPPRIHHRMGVALSGNDLRVMTSGAMYKGLPIIVRVVVPRTTLAAPMSVTCRSSTWHGFMIPQWLMT